MAESGQSDRIPRTEAGRLTLQIFGPDVLFAEHPDPMSGEDWDNLARQIAEAAAPPEPPPADTLLDALLAKCPTSDSPLPDRQLLQTWIPDLAEAADAVRESLMGRAAAPPEPPLDVLRERWQRFGPEPSLDDFRRDPDAVYAWFKDGLAAPPEPPLDVERLAEAMSMTDGIKWPWYWNREDTEGVASRVAAEYDRLGGAAPERLPSVRTPRFIAAVRRVFEAPGEDFGPARGYYGGDIDHFIDMLAASLHEEPTEEQTDG